MGFRDFHFVLWVIAAGAPAIVPGLRNSMPIFALEAVPLTVVIQARQ
jgi:hypothetical protein